MHDWEVLAMEERSIRENLGEKVGDLEEQAVNYKEAFEKAAAERDAQSVTVDGLQKALQEIQSGKTEFPQATYTPKLMTAQKLERRSFESSLRALKPN
jgi:hypothetical protein